MAFPVQTELLSTGLMTAQAEARRVKTVASEYQTAFARGNVSANLMLDLYGQLLAARVVFVRVRALPGLPEYAKAQFADVGLDILGAFDMMSAALADAVAEITKAFPQDKDGYLLREQFAQDGFSVRVFTPDETSLLQSALAALSSTIG